MTGDVGLKTENSKLRTRLGSALFNADHTRLGQEILRVAAAGADFVHFDVFDGHFVPDMAFAPRTIGALRPLTALPFEVHLAASDPVRFLPALAGTGANLVFLPAEGTPLLYEAIFAMREQGLQAGLCLALGTPLGVLEPVLPLLDAVLLLGRVTGEGRRGRDFNELLIERVRRVRAMIDAGKHAVDLQAAGGLETDSCRAVVAAGATSLPLGAALHREPDMAAYLAHLRGVLSSTPQTSYRRPSGPSLQTHNYKVLIASRSFGPNCPAAIERMRAAGYTLIANSWGRAPTEAELIERIGDVDALISGTEPVTARVINAAAHLKVIAKHGVGYENIDLPAAAARGIPVTIAGGAIADSVADLALALILALARHVTLGDRAVRSGTWPRLVGMELRGKTLGIVGLGQIGKAVCRRAVGFGLHVVAYDAYPDLPFATSWGVRFLTLEELLATSDIVTLHAPALAETHHLINQATLAQMKPTALLVNTARGDLVHEAALADALQRGVIAGAASDVFEREPPGQHALLALDNFIATPHSAGQTEDGLRRMGDITAENVLLVLAGKQPLFRAT